MSRGIYYGNRVRKYFILQKYTNSHCLRIRHAIHGTSVSSHASAIDTNANNEASVKRGPMKSVRDGPSLRDFLGSSIIDIPREEPVPYVQDIRGENQKGFSYFHYKVYCCLFLSTANLLLLFFFSSVL